MTLKPTLRQCIALVVAAPLITMGVLYAAYQSATPPPPPLSAFVPQGSLLSIEATDFAALLSSWSASSEQRRWLTSDNYEAFSRSRLFARLGEAQDQFAAVQRQGDGAVCLHIEGSIEFFEISDGERGHYDAGKAAIRMGDAAGDGDDPIARSDAFDRFAEVSPVIRMGVMKSIAIPIREIDGLIARKGTRDADAVFVHDRQGLQHGQGGHRGRQEGLQAGQRLSRQPLMLNLFDQTDKDAIGRADRVFRMLRQRAGEVGAILLGIVEGYDLFVPGPHDVRPDQRQAHDADESDGPGRQRQPSGEEPRETV